jgi:hypothetical protein
MGTFRFPDGVEFLGDDGDGHAHFRVSIPLDDDGYFGRECPSCDQQFRMCNEDYDQLPDDLQLWCVYCGHHDDHSEFMTSQQQGRTMRAASDYAHQLVSKMLDDTFGRMARRSRPSIVRISYRSKPFFPAPLPGIDEERLVRQRSCARCGVRYAVFGEHRYCPVCGQLPALIAALDALNAEEARLDLLSELPDKTKATAREIGMLDRTYVDAIENTVAIVEATGERVFRERVDEPDNLLRGKGKIFQRLEDMADLFSDALGIDLRAAVGQEWLTLLEYWAARHVHTHNDGVVDDRYLHAVPSSPLRLGQRLAVSERSARHTVELARHLLSALAPKPGESESDT